MRRAKFQQADGRALVPRKWSVDKFSGPLVFVAETILKRLIQHGWAASYRKLANDDQEALLVRFENEGGNTPEFLRACDLIAEIVNRRLGVAMEMTDGLLRLVGRWSMELVWNQPKPGSDGKRAIVRVILRLVGSSECPF